MGSGGRPVIAILLFGLLYLATIVLVVRAVPIGEHGWAMTAAILALLLIEKLVELRAGEIATVVAHAQGWYEQRRAMQVTAILAFSTIGLLCVVLAALLTRGLARVALTTAILLGAFAFVRGASFHLIEHILGAAIGPIRVRHVVEIGCLAVIAGAAIRALQPAGVAAARRRLMARRRVA